ncbi:hypothetical protein ACTG9Q_28945 [Actinokineospora sp. 24-640]
MIPCLPPEHRQATWRALAEALTPGGLLLFDPPPEHPTRRQVHWSLPSTQLGPDLYSAHVTSTPHDQTQQLRFTYRVHRASTLIREEHEDFTIWPTPSTLLTDELRQAGFTPAPTPHPALSATRLQA